MPISRDPVHWQWSPLIAFLVLFALGLAVIGWMIWKIISLPKTETASTK